MITGNRQDYLELARKSKDRKFQIVCLKNFARVLNKKPLPLTQ